eukprot:Selendium_serpulae@DN6304_c1_g1_i6.p1
MVSGIGIFSDFNASNISSAVRRRSSPGDDGSAASGSSSPRERLAGGMLVTAGFSSVMFDKLFVNTTALNDCQAGRRQCVSAGNFGKLAPIYIPVSIFDSEQRSSYPYYFPKLHADTNIL